MKVTICGAQGVGKTTLVDSLSEKWQKYVIKKVIRNIVLHSTQEVKVNEEADAYGQTLFFAKYLQILNSKDNYITDRGLVDVAAYTKYLVYKRKLGSGIYQNQIRSIQERLSKNPDEVFVYIPIEFELEDDGFRSMDKIYQDEIDRSFREVFEDLGVEPIVICGAPDKRLKDLETILTKLEKKKKVESPNKLKPYKKLDIMPAKTIIKSENDEDAAIKKALSTIKFESFTGKEFEIAVEEATKMFEA